MDEMIKEEICDHYCKWPEWFKQYFRDPEMAHQEMLEEACSECPLNKKEDKNE